MPANHPNIATGFSVGDWSRIAAATSDSVLLRTARPDAENRRSFLFANPARILSASNPDEIPKVFAEMETALSAGCHVAGFVSYEAGQHFEPAAVRSGPPATTGDLPLVWFGVYERPLAREEPERPPSEIRAPLDESAAPGELLFGISWPEYSDTIERIRRYIAAGDIYQANFTVPVRGPWRGDAGTLFETMMANQPVAYGALLNLGGTTILSASPELFFRRRGSEMLVRPMKGTTRRGRDTGEDAERAAWLAADRKNRAENVMIVDLLRNDLGRICATGSIRVSDLFAVERYPELFQMTSTIRGELRPGTSYYEIFRSLFPCGSITGAPKIRTMQVIRELEHEPRGIACGAIGFFSPENEAVFSVAIRTAVLRKGELIVRVGSGVTYDSDAAAEWQECRLKAKFLTHAPAEFELIETMLWNGEYFLLDRHLARLADSAAYFDFAFDEAAVREQLRRFDLDSSARHRVRLLVSRAGAISLTSEPVSHAPPTAALVLAAERTNSADPFLRHKTTKRDLYDRALAQARARGFDDALFLNERGEVTEGAIHNLMIAKAGRFLTPRLDCGLLPGVYRRWLLDCHPEVEEAVIGLDDLKNAERIFVFNSVRGLRRAGRIDWTPA